MWLHPAVSNGLFGHGLVLVSTVRLHISQDDLTWRGLQGGGGHVWLLDRNQRLRVKTQNLYGSFDAHSASVALRSASSESILTDLAGAKPPPLRCHYLGATTDSATAFLEVSAGSSCRTDSLGDACRWGMGTGG